MPVAADNLNSDIQNTTSLKDELLKSPWIQDEAIYKPNLPSEEPNVGRSVSLSNALVHPIRASTTIFEAALRGFLEQKASPLQDYSREILFSPYWSTIIAICTIEEYSCSVNPHDTNNLWGLMSKGHLISYPTLGAGIDAIEAFLAKAEANGRTTIESFRGWYCYDAKSTDHVCWNWETVVLRTKALLESL